MADKLGSFLVEFFGNPYVTVFVISMIPLIELKGAIPVGMTPAFGLTLIEAAALAYLGSTLISFLVFFLLKPVFALLKKISFFNLLVRKCEGLFIRKAEKISAKTNGSVEKEARRIMIISLLIFVAVPFPVTGVWTGTAIGVFLGLRFRDVVIPLALGNLIAGAIITLLTFIFNEYVDIIVYSLFALAIIMLIVTVIKIAKSKPSDE